MPVTTEAGWAFRLERLRAMAWLTLGHRTAALAVFDRMLARWPRSAYALASRSHLHASQGRRDEAIADAQALVAAHPERGAADWYNLAFLLEEASQLGPAEQAFRRAVEIDPKLDRAWYGLGLTLVVLRRLDDAVTALKRNTALQPMSPYGWYQLARVQMERKEPEKALKIIRHLKGFEPKVAAQLERETGLSAQGSCTAWTEVCHGAFRSASRGVRRGAAATATPEALFGSTCKKEVTTNATATLD